MRGLNPLIVSLVLALSPLRAAAEPPPTATGHRYVLEARLDAKKHRIRGKGTIHWRNNSEHPQSLLFLHLYANAFQDRRTLFMRESGTEIRGTVFREPGWIRVTRLAIAGGADLLPSSTARGFEPNDSTQIQVTLPEPVQSGGELVLETEFATTLPSVVARMGYAGSFHMVAQWFPKPARLEEDGSWAKFPYHGMGEFYADFADYDIRIDVPERYAIAAPGERVSEQLKGGRRIERYSIRNVHDVAWAAYPHFEREQFQFGPTRVSFAAPPGYSAAVHRQARILRLGLQHFGKLYGPYAYPELLVVLPPTDARGVSGMEYPTMFASAGGWFALPWLSLPDPIHDMVAAHELAHQWFCGMIATNEVAYPVLDEGLTEWASQDLLRSIAQGGRLPLPLDTFDVYRRFLHSRWVDSSLKPAPLYDSDQLFRAVYVRPALLLETVARTWGRGRLQEALGAYARSQRFRHPRPEDLFVAFDDVYWPGFSDRVLRPGLEGKSFDAEISSVATGREADLYTAVVTVTRTGDVALPTWVMFENAAGDRKRLAWPTDRNRMRFEVKDSTPIVGVSIDPDHANLLDARLTDNQRTLAGARRRGSVFAWLIYGLQTLLSLVGP